jgi:hypothetical protein
VSVKLHHGCSCHTFCLLVVGLLSGLCVCMGIILLGIHPWIIFKLTSSENSLIHSSSQAPPGLWMERLSVFFFQLPSTFEAFWIIWWFNAFGFRDGTVGTKSCLWVISKNRTQGSNKEHWGENIRINLHFIAWGRCKERYSYFHSSIRPLLVKKNPR